MQGECSSSLETEGLRLLCLALLLCLYILATTAFSIRGENYVSFSMTETDNHHVARLNSNQPYVAGCCVTSEGLMNYGTVDAVAVDVSFPSTDPSYFPVGSWLGAGMFLQGQDTRFLHVDYGFYMMLVIDASAGLYIDIGLHQTREGDRPLLMPSEELMFFRTWQLSSLDPATSVILTMGWDENETVNYCVALGGQQVEFASVRAANLPNCENIIPGFYSGNVIVGQFPMSRYVNYFQFGIISPSTIANNHWAALLENPRTLSLGNWSLVDRAWSVQGDRSYIDQDWRWGGRPYIGGGAQYHMNSAQSSDQVLFFHSDRTLSTGTVLWQPVNAGTSGTTDSMLRDDQNDRPFSKYYCPACYFASALILICTSATYWMLEKNSKHGRYFRKPVERQQ
jgi:hypothetical protein